MNQQDEKVLEELGLESIPDDEKKAVLAMIDQRLEKRFLANLLLSLDDDKRQTLEGKIDEIEEPKVEDVVRIALDIQPDAAEILAKSANEVMTELKGENISKAQGVGSEASEAEIAAQDTNSSNQDTQQPAPNTPQPAEDLPPVGANATTSVDNSIPSENNPSPETRTPEPNPSPPATPYNFDDTARQTSNATADYYKP